MVNVERRERGLSSSFSDDKGVRHEMSIGNERQLMNIVGTHRKHRVDIMLVECVEPYCLGRSQYNVTG